MSSKPGLIRHPVVWVVVIVWLSWLAIMEAGNHWHLFSSEWFITVTMVFGSFIAGATSEGGGAVAFPVMTLVFEIEPVVARDFSILIQSVGMMAASVGIFTLRIPVCRRTILWAGLGGAPGMIVGLEFVAPLLSPAITKIFFMSVWLSFAGSLYWINLNRAREVRLDIGGVGPRSMTILLVVGFLGGTLSGITGSGLDIVTFSCLVLAFRVCEKVATPTSVVLMGSNALVGALWREGLSSGLSPEAWQYWYVCVPVVVVGAPVGAWFIKDRSRRFVAGFLYVSIVVQYVAAMVIVPVTARMVAFSVAIVVLGLLGFWSLAVLGGRRLERRSVRNEQSPG